MYLATHIVIAGWITSVAITRVRGREYRNTRYHVSLRLLEEKKTGQSNGCIGL